MTDPAKPDEGRDAAEAIFDSLQDVVDVRTLQAKKHDLVAAIRRALAARAPAAAQGAGDAFEIAARICEGRQRGHPEASSAWLEAGKCASSIRSEYLQKKIGDVLAAAPAQAPAAMPEPDCPGPDCPMCNGEGCDLCGAGFGPQQDVKCQHDSEERHRPRAASDSPASSREEEKDDVRHEVGHGGNEAGSRGAGGTDGRAGASSTQGGGGPAGGAAAGGRSAAREASAASGSLAATPGAAPQHDAAPACDEFGCDLPGPHVHYPPGPDENGQKSVTVARHPSFLDKIPRIANPPDAAPVKCAHDACDETATVHGLFSLCARCNAWWVTPGSTTPCPCSRPARAAPAMVVCDLEHGDKPHALDSYGWPCINPRPAPAPAPEKQLSGEEAAVALDAMLDICDREHDEHCSKIVHIRAALSAKDAEAKATVESLERFHAGVVAAREAELARVMKERDVSREAGQIWCAQQERLHADLAAALARVEVLRGLVAEALAGPKTRDFEAAHEWRDAWETRARAALKGETK